MTTPDPWDDPAAQVHAGRDEVVCDRCGALVLVTKNSWRQTCVQWSARAESRCAVLGTAGADGFGGSGGGGRRAAARVEGCPALRDSIDRALVEGRLVVRSGGRP